MSGTARSPRAGRKASTVSDRVRELLHTSFEKLAASADPEAQVVLRDWPSLVEALDEE